MRLLLDTNIVIMLVGDRNRLSAAAMAALTDPHSSYSVSVVSFWEIAIKHRSGKLAMAVKPTELIGAVRALGIDVLDMKPLHAVADPDLPSELKDPFDRMIVAIAEAEGLSFLTTDTKLRDHPLAWRP